MQRHRSDVGIGRECHRGFQFATLGTHMRQASLCSMKQTWTQQRPGASSQSSPCQLFKARHTLTIAEIMLSSWSTHGSALIPVTNRPFIQCREGLRTR